MRRRDNGRGPSSIEMAFSRDWIASRRTMRLTAFQILHVPRHFDDPEPEDDGPEEQLREMFARVRKALLTWTECLDLLPPHHSKAP